MFSKKLYDSQLAGMIQSYVPSEYAKSLLLDSLSLVKDILREEKAFKQKENFKQVFSALASKLTNPADRQQIFAKEPKAFVNSLEKLIKAGYDKLAVSITRSYIELDSYVYELESMGYLDNFNRIFTKSVGVEFPEKVDLEITAAIEEMRPIVKPKDGNLIEEEKSSGARPLHIDDYVEDLLYGLEAQKPKHVQITVDEVAVQKPYLKNIKSMLVNPEHQISIRGIVEGAPNLKKLEKNGYVRAGDKYYAKQFIVVLDGSYSVYFALHSSVLFR